MPFVRSGDVHVYYELHGPAPGTAPAIVFAHGMGGNHLSWWQQVPYFRDRYTCVTFDHRGFGQSVDVPDGPGGAAFVDDLHALVDHLGLHRTHLVAQSMGGWTCLGFALRAPHRVERLVMCDTPGGLLTGEMGAAWSVKDPAAVMLPADAHPAAGERMYREQPHLHFLYTQIAGLNPSRTLDEMLGVIQAAGTVTADAVAALTLPVLFIVGEEDMVIPPRVLELAMQHFPNAHLQRVPAAGHSVYFERAETFNALVGRFLTGLGDTQ
jgi:3-oxoadipate enol-lactonase